MTTLREQAQEAAIKLRLEATNGRSVRPQDYADVASDLWEKAYTELYNASYWDAAEQYKADIGTNPEIPYRTVKGGKTIP